MSFLQNASVYYINLEERKDRKEYITSHFNSLGIKNYHRVAAVTPDDVSQKALTKGTELGCTRNEVACSASHLKAVKHFLETSSSKYALICEDDVDLSNLVKIDFTIDELFASQNSSVECIQLAVSTREDLQINFTAHDHSFWDFCTAAYAITRVHAQKLVDTYCKENHFVLDFFASKRYIDYRGSVENWTTPAAENLLFWLTNTTTCPLFTYQTFSSSIQDTTEQERQAVKSRNDFYAYWDARSIVSIKDVEGR